MEKKRTQAADIVEIASKLDGKVEFSTIVYSQQMLSEQLGLPTEYTHIGMFNPETCAKVGGRFKKIFGNHAICIKKTR